MIRRRLLCFALPAALMGLACATASAQLAPLPSPVDTPVTEVWQALQQRTPALDGPFYDAVDAVFAEGLEAADPAVCRQQAENLAEGRAQMPVSLMQWLAAIACAEALEDEAAAAEALQAFAALSRHLLEGRPRIHGIGAPPPLLSETDVYALVAGLEWELNYIHYEPSARQPPVLVASMTDPEAGREHLLRFDPLPVFAAAVRGQGEPWTPLQRLQVANMLYGLSAELGPGAPGPRAQRLQQAGATASGPGADLAPLAALVSEGDFYALEVLFNLCRLQPGSGCGETVVDLLLGPAELDLAAPLWMLATAHAAGIGVRRDERAAERLYDRADTRLGDARATLAAAWQWLDLGDAANPLPRALARRLQGLAKAGDADAAELLLLADLAGHGTRRFGAREQARFGAAAQARLPRLRGLYAERLIDEDPARALPLLESAAAAGDGRAQLRLRMELEKQADPASRGRRQQLDEQLALHGHAPAALRLARQHRDRGEQRAAHGWFVSAGVFGHDAALADAIEAGLATHPPRLERAGALRQLEQRLARGPDPDVALLLARLLLQGDTPDPIRAAALLREQVAAGGPDARIQLAFDLATGRLPAAPGEDPRALLEAAIADGSDYARDRLALLIYTGRVEGSAEEAVQLWQQAIEGGSVLALNNLAWLQCVSTEADYHAPMLGIVHAMRLPVDENSPPWMHSTQAACHAAVGQFERAAELQRGLLARSHPADFGEARMAFYRAQLDRFERGEPPRRPPQETLAEL